MQRLVVAASPSLEDDRAQATIRWTSRYVYAEALGTTPSSFEIRRTPCIGAERVDGSRWTAEGPT